MASDEPLRSSARIETFEWDENKRSANIIKHGIDFADAKDAFYDPAAFTFASRLNALERRYVTVGSVNGTVIAVIFTVRGQAIRIISARADRRSERQTYGAKAKKQRPGSLGK